ncbi:GNAT family N-acyltransferase [Rhodoblastus sp.]|uniref:GNAT family N-acyltransferase n=1 Tax=Rhodoblastus sp. TaxID=1962975 RepID=UPI0035B4D3FD
MLPLRFGELVLSRCIELLGMDILSSLSFITRHIALDGAHTDLNAQMLTDLLEQAPWSLPALATAGSAALDAYADFLGDCLRLAKDHLRRADNCVTLPHQSIRFQIMAPPTAISSHDAEFSCPDWLAEVRSLRGSALFDNGRRPAFRTMGQGGCSDADPIDLHAYHLLAYAECGLIGCVRLYHLDPAGPPCVTEEVLGQERFSQLLQNLRAAHDDIVEVGRWVVQPDYRTSNFDLGISIQLAAGSAALAKEIGCAAGKRDGFVICAAGVADRQCAMLKRIGMTPIAGVGAASCARYRDDVQILCCSQRQWLHPQFLRLVDLMERKLGFSEGSSATATGSWGLIGRRTTDTYPSLA